MIPRLTDGGTVVCIASGPSLTTEDVESVRGQVVIAINDAVRLAPWAQVLYSSDSLWWDRYKGMPKFQGLRFKVSPSPFRVENKKQPGKEHLIGVNTLRNAGEPGISFEADTVCTGKNSGHAAVNLAVHLGAKRILLLGYDMGPHKGRHHFYDKDPVQHNSPYQMFRKYMATAVQPLKDAGIEVLNCTRQTNLECFPLVKLEDALRDCAVSPNL